MNVLKKLNPSQEGGFFLGQKTENTNPPVGGFFFNSDVFCQLKIKLSKQILYKSDNFYLIHDGFPLLEGHLLIVPKNHINCLLNLNKNLKDEFNYLKKLAVKFLDNNYSAPVMFEHGVIGQTLPHAHLHLLPTKKSLLQKLRKEMENINNDPKIPYLYYSEKGKEYYSTTTRKVISGYFHHNFAYLLGRPLDQKERGKELKNWLLNVKKKWKIWKENQKKS